MSIYYPLVIPAGIGEAKANLKMFDAVGEAISPFDGSAQQQQWQDQHWELDLVWPEMTWADFAALQAFAGALHGKLGSFLWGPPLATGPRGTGGTPVAASGLNLIIGTGIRSGGTVTLAFLGSIPPSIAAGLQVAVSVPYDSSFNGTFTIASVYPVWAGNTAYWAISYSQAGPNASWGDTGRGVRPSAQFPSINPNLAGSNLLSVSGFLPSQSGVLLPGDFMQIAAPDTGNVSRVRLYQYVGQSPLATDGGGNATLDIFPCLREAPSPGTAIVLVNPQGTFRLADNRREAPADRTKTFTFDLKCREAI